jgi:hypothetical protein
MDDVSRRASAPAEVADLQDQQHAHQQAMELGTLLAEAADLRSQWRLHRQAMDAISAEMKALTYRTRATIRHSRDAMARVRVR